MRKSFAVKSLAFVIALSGATGALAAANNAGGGKGASAGSAGGHGGDTGQVYNVESSDLRVTGSVTTYQLPPPDFMGMENRLKRYMLEELPLTPEQIRYIKRKMLESERAKWSQVYKPKIVKKVMSVDADAQSKIPTVYLTPGFVGTIVFVDAQGKPWPLSAGPVVGNNRLIDLKVPNNSGGNNIIVVSAKKPSGMSNISVFLHGKDAPIIVNIVNSVKKHYARADMVMRDYLEGDGGGERVRSVPASAASAEMLALVNGAVVDGMQGLKSSTRDIRAWRMGSYLYIRTRHQVISPGWINKVAGADGVKVYKMKMTTRVLYSAGGEVRTAKISEF